MLFTGCMGEKRPKVGVGALILDEELVLLANMVVVLQSIQEYQVITCISQEH